MARADISYDFTDFGLTAEQLQDKYNGLSHPEYTMDQWKLLANSDDSTKGYWSWVVDRIQEDDDAIPGNNEEGNPPKTDLAFFNDIDLFAAHLTAWHSRKVALLEHMLQIPEGTEFEVKINDVEQKVILDGDALVAFRGGIATALMELGQLPFMAVPIETPESKPDAG